MIIGILLIIIITHILKYKNTKYLLLLFQPIKIDRRPVTRDVIVYIFNVSVLVAIVWDGIIYWYEALVLGILYILYFVIMFNSTRIFKVYDKMTSCCCNKNIHSDSEGLLLFSKY